MKFGRIQLVCGWYADWFWPDPSLLQTWHGLIAVNQIAAGNMALAEIVRFLLGLPTPLPPHQASVNVEQDSAGCPLF